MEKYKEPQVYVINNSEIAEKLQEEYIVYYPADYLKPHTADYLKPILSSNKLPCTISGAYPTNYRSHTQTALCMAPYHYPS